MSDFKHTSLLMTEHEQVIDEIEKRGRQSLLQEISDLRAEIAGLKTGYEAYEAQNAALRKALSDCADELAAEIICKHGGQKLEDMHPVTRRLYERDMAAVTEARAAMGKGEQP